MRASQVRSLLYARDQLLYLIEEALLNDILFSAHLFLIFLKILFHFLDRFKVKSRELMGFLLPIVPLLFNPTHLLFVNALLSLPFVSKEKSYFGSAPRIEFPSRDGFIPTTEALR